jgi:7-cyano-7-deazaguanine reductase
MELGKQSHYESSYNPARLLAIPRAAQRKALGIDGAPPFLGHDLWNHYEVSWLDIRGKPRVAIAQIVYASTSENIVESKSLKLYFNTLNNTRFENTDALTEVVARDLTSCVGQPVSISIDALDDATHRIVSPLAGTCIDDIKLTIDRFTVDPAYLSAREEYVEETLYSNLLKSNCLITGQPDWASVWIEYTGNKICKEGLLRYIVSYRDHSEFHEHCVERIFMDIMQRCSPSTLTVGARFTRRGGIDINPVRSTHVTRVENNRLARQ